MISSTIISIALSLSSCGKDDYSGTYSGASGNTTLILNDDNTCTYDEYGAFSSVHWDGTYEVDDDTITLDFKDGKYVLSAEIKEDGKLYIIGEDGWSPELFTKD